MIHPVDERVNIFQNYDDSLYDKFISEAKKIFKKYNEDQYCNPDNLKLLYDPNNRNECYTFENDSYAHGGYECDVETKKWSKTKCKPYYCDIGYYFDTYQNICVKDKCTEAEDKTDDNDDTMLFILLIAILSLVGLIIIGLIIYGIYSFCCQKDRDSNVGPLIDHSGTKISMRNVEDS